MEKMTEMCRIFGSILFFNHKLWDLQSLTSIMYVRVVRVRSDPFFSALNELALSVCAATYVSYYGDIGFVVDLNSYVCSA